MLEPVELTFAKFILELPADVKDFKESTIRIIREGEEENELEG